MLRDPSSSAASGSPKKIFSGVRFVLFGFDSVSEAQYRSELVDGGGVDVGRYDSSCTHVIVSGRAFDDPSCVAARNDRKILVTELWIDDSLDFGKLADSTKVLYRPVKDLSGIPGSKSLHICLTGYQRQERDDIMRMVSLMGGCFSKPLIANQATHLICYKFEGEKYELAKKVNIKLVNHRWLEDCLKAWEILPIDNYTKSGWELEMLEAEAMDSEEEAEDAGRKIKELSIGEPHSSRGETSVVMASGTSVETRNISRQKDVLAAQPFDLSVDNQLIYTPHNESSSGKAAVICDTKNKVPKVLDHLEAMDAEQFPHSHGTGINIKQLDASVCTDLNMKCNSLPSDVRNSLVDMRLSPPSYSRKANEKVVSPGEQFNNLCAPHKGGQGEVNLKGDANNSSVESNNNAPKEFINSNLHSPLTGLAATHVEGQTYTLPQKRKLCVSRIGSKSMKLDNISRTSGLLNASTGIHSLELDSLNPQQQEPEGILTHTENTDALPQLQNLSASRTYLRSPKLAQFEVDHGRTCMDNFEGTALVQPKGNQHGQLSKSSSLGYKRKSLKQGHPTSVANISSNLSSKFDKKDELLRSPSMAELDGSVYTRNEAVSGVGTMYDITSPEATVLSDCPQNNGTGRAEDRSTVNKPNFYRSPLAVNGGNANSASIGKSVLDASSKSMKKSETAAKSHNCAGDSAKHTPDVYNKVTEQHETQDEEVTTSALKDTKDKSSAGTEIHGSHEQNKENESTIRGNHKVFAKKKVGCMPKARRKNGCKDKSSDNSLKSINADKTAIISGNGAVNDLPAEEKTEVKQNHQPEINSDVIQNEKHVVLENETNLTNSCNFSVKNDDDCDHMAKRKCETVILGAKISGKDNISPFLKQNSSNPVLSEPVCFILSGNHAQRKEYQIIIRRLRGRICKGSHNWSYKATHFIVPDNVRRTEKFFAAAAAGRWILRPEYLTASSEAGKFLDEEPFEWYRKGLTEDGAINLEAPRKWRTLKQRTGCGAFYGMRIIIYGECIAPSLDTLKRVVKAGDGTILATSPPYTRFINSGVDFAVVSASMPHVDVWVQEFLRHEIPCVLTDYLVEYVCKPGFSLDRHVLYKTHTWAEKSFANLQSRITEEMVSDKGSNEDSSDDLVCSVCGSRERGEVMLICGNDVGTLGCGLGTHIDCCDPPLAAVPEDDWFCSTCNKKSGRKNPTKSPKVKLKKGK